MHMQNYIKRKRKVDYFTCVASSILSSSKSCCTSGAQPSCEEVDGLEISTKESRCLCLCGTKSTPGGTSTVSTSRYLGTAHQQCSHLPHLLLQAPASRYEAYAVAAEGVVREVERQEESRKRYQRAAAALFLHNPKNFT